MTGRTNGDTSILSRLFRTNKMSEREMDLIGHLDELRLRLMMAVILLVLGVLAGTLFARRAVEILARPFSRIELRTQSEALRIRVEPDGGWVFVDPVGEEMFRAASTSLLAFYLPESDPAGPPDFVWGTNPRRPVFFSPLDPIRLYFQAALILGVIFSLPFILHQVWLFVAPGLKSRERLYAGRLLWLGGVLFPAGAAFAYFLLSPILNILVNFQVMSLEPQLEITRLIGFELRLMGMFGVIFELPLVVMFLTLIGVVSPRMMRRYRPHAIMVMAFLAMTITPPDPISMLLVLGPLVILYEVSIWLSLPFVPKAETTPAKS